MAGIASPVSIHVPLATLLPALAVLSFRPVAGRPAMGEETAPRPTATYRLVLLVALLSVALALQAIAGSIVGQLEQPVQAGRNLAGLLGLALLLQSWLGDAAWLCPPMFTAMELMFGGSRFAEPPAWAWSLARADRASSGWTATALAGAGVALLAVRWRGRWP
jgi:hypothetical protein